MTTPAQVYNFSSTSSERVATKVLRAALDVGLRVSTGMCTLTVHVPDLVRVPQSNTVLPPNFSLEQSPIILVLLVYG